MLLCEARRLNSVCDLCDGYGCCGGRRGIHLTDVDRRIFDHPLDPPMDTTHEASPSQTAHPRPSIQIPLSCSGLSARSDCSLYEEQRGGETGDLQIPGKSGNEPRASQPKQLNVARSECIRPPHSRTHSRAAFRYSGGPSVLA